MLPETVTLKETRQESPRVKTFVFDKPVKAEPGQFVMLWLPGVNEKPFGICRPDPLTITVACIGDFTEKLCAKKPGDRMAFRGPFGNPFKLVGKKILLVGGGYGSAPLHFLAEAARKKGIDVTVVLGAKTAGDIILKREFESLGCTLALATDDGTAGTKGFCTGPACGLLDKEKFDCVYSCGPEKMMRKIGEECAARGVPCQLSLERFFKCGIGVCGQCSCDGLLVCRDGPVFDAQKVLATKDFGTTKRDASGRKVRM
jgi:dihydroorotate dehydrogenase electron transfer subunit